MNNKHDNELNFDFDSPIENFISESSDDGGEVFDLAAYAASGEKKNSRAKRNRLSEEIERDKSIEEEQNRFHSNREKHAAQNAETRTAPHAITADELMRGRRQKTNTPPKTMQVNPEFDELMQKTETVEDEKAVTGDGNYSDAAQLVFEKMRHRKDAEADIEAEIPISEEEPSVENDLTSSDVSVDKEIHFGNPAREETVTPIKYIFNHDEISETQPINETYIKPEYSYTPQNDTVNEPDFVQTSGEENIEIHDNLTDDDIVDYFGGVDDFDDSDEDVPVQPLYETDDFDNSVSDSFEAELGEELYNTDYENDNLTDSEQVSFESFDSAEGQDEYFNDLIEDLPSIGSSDDSFDFEDENDNVTYEYADEGDLVEIDGEADYDDVGFDLLDSADDLFIDGEIPPVPVNGHFDDLDTELLSDLSPRKATVFDKKLVNAEYHNIDDEYDVRCDLTKRKNNYLIKFIVCAVNAFISIILCTGITPIVPLSQLFWIVIAIFNIATLVVNFDGVKSIIYAVEGDTEPELVPALAAVFSLLQAVLGIFKIIVFETNLVFAVVTSAIFAFTALADYIRTLDIIKNFDLICNEDEKEIVTFVEQPDSNKVMDAEQGMGYRIASRKKAKDVQEFIEYSMSTGPYEEFSGKITIAAFVGSIIMAVIFAIVGKSAAYAVAGFCGGFCIAAPVSSLILTIIAVRRVNAVLKRYNAVMPGYMSGKNIDNTNVVCVDANDLFGSDSVKLYNIKTFGGLPLDKALIDASALLTAANSPMKGMFNDISSGEAIPVTDSIAYEEKMGISGWVGGRKTLIGNRMIMETHGISVPPIDIDKKIIMNGYFPVYLASEGQLSALFIVGYNADPNVSYCLKQIFNSGLTLLVKTCDPNITEEMIADYFGIHRDSVKIMSHESEILMNKAQTSDSATLLCNDTNGYLNGILASIKLCKYSWYAAVAQIIVIALAFMIFGIVAATGSVGFLNVVSLFVYNLLSLFIVYVFHTKYV